MADQSQVTQTQAALFGLTAQAETLRQQLMAAQARGIVWNDPEYQVLQSQYTAATSAIPAAAQLANDTYNQAMGIIGSSGYSPATNLTSQKTGNATQAQIEAQYNAQHGVITNNGQTGITTQTGGYAQALANSGVSVTPLGNQLPQAYQQQQQSIQSNRMAPLPEQLNAGTPYNTMVNAINQYQDRASYNQIVQQGYQGRAGFYGLQSENLGAARTIGDSQTQAYQRAMGNFSQVLGNQQLRDMGVVSGFVPAALSSEQSRTALALEFQRSNVPNAGRMVEDTRFNTTTGKMEGTGTYTLVGGQKEAQYYNNELQKTLQRPIEKSSEYHYVGKALGIPVPANPFEAQGDIAVEILKGSPGSREEWFSPLSGLASQYLPGMGVQEQAWQTARTGVAPQVSFMPALGVFAAAEGQYGPYGSLFGGPNYQGTPSSEGIRMQAPFVLTPEIVADSYAAIRAGNTPTSISEGQTYADMRLQPTTFEATSKGNLAGFGVSDRLIGSGKVAGEATVVPIGGAPLPATPISTTLGSEMSLTERLINSISQSPSVIPGGLGLAMALDTASGKSNPLFEAFRGTINKPGSVTIEQYQQNLDKYNRNLDTYNAEKNAFELTDRTNLGSFAALSSRYTGLESEKSLLESQSKNIQLTPVEKVGGIYTGANKWLAQYTTDISGIGRALSTAPEFAVGETPSAQNRILNAVNIGKNVYVGASQSPIELAVGYGSGALLGAGIGLAGRGVAAAAMSDIGAANVIGRTASTPLAADIGRAVLTGAGVVMVGLAGKNIMDQPTTAERSQVLGKTAIGFAGFPSGFDSGKGAIPLADNVYAGREFFSGQPAMGPFERAAFELNIAARAPFTSEPSAYRDVAVMTKTMRFVEPGVRNIEPDIAGTSAAGPYANTIRQITSEQPTMIMGSTSVRSQYTPEIIEAVNMRIPKDIDIYAETPSVLGERFTAETGLPHDVAMDIKPMHDIPGFKNSVEQNTDIQDFTPMSSRIFGDPYERLAKPRSTSEILFRGEDYGVGKIGETAQQGAQVQMGGKGQGASRAIEQPMERGYRGGKDIYDLITTYDAQRMTAVGRGTPESQFSAGDVARADLMTRTLTFGTEKSPIGGQGNPSQKTTTETVQQIYDRFASEVIAGKHGRNERPDVTEPGFVSSDGVSRSASYSPAASKIFSGSEISSEISSLTGSGYGISSPSPSVMLSTGTSPSIRSGIGSPSPGIIKSVPRSSPTTTASPSDLGSPLPSSIISPSLFGSPGSPGSPSATSIIPPSPSPPSPSGSYGYPPPPPPPPSQIPPGSPLGSLLGSGGGGGKGTRRRKRKVELFSFEMGEDTPIPRRYGLGGQTVMYIPGTRGIAVNILPRGDIAPNRLFDITDSGSGDHL